LLFTNLIKNELWKLLPPEEFISRPDNLNFSLDCGKFIFEPKKTNQVFGSFQDLKLEVNLPAS